MSAIEYAETKQIKNIADSIISLANDYNSEINKLFNMFAAVPYDTKEWVGNQSDKFFDLVALEKDDFINFGDRIREYGEKLNDDVVDIENTVSTYNKVGIFAKHQIEVPIYKGIATYSGEKTTKKYNVKFSAPSMYEMYSSYYDSFWYIESSKQSDIKYASSYNGTVYFDMDDITDINTHIMYTGYMKKTSVIISGSGTMSDPYEVDY